MNINYEEETNDSEIVLTEDESDQIINNLKDELIMESIMEQIENPLINSFGNADYLDIFETRYSYLKEVYKSSDTFIRKLENVKINMYSEIFLAIAKKFELSYTDANFNIIDCTYALYSFFILNYKDNLTEYLLNRVIREKKTIAMSLNKSNFSKKLGYNALKKILKYKEDALIISNIVNVVDMIIQQNIDNLDIIKDICEDDINEASNYQVYQYMLNDFSLAPSHNFNKLFFDILLNKKEGYSFIINEIKVKLLNLAIKK